MGRKQHKVQHKQERDERRAKELQELKSENRKLEKQVARLRKEVAKHITESEVAEQTAQEETQPDPVSSTKKVQCCDGGVTRLKGPTKTYIYCTTCKKRLGEEKL